MYCCPISAFNWCPRGRAGPERGHSLLSPLPHTAKVKFITHVAIPWEPERGREAGKEGRGTAPSRRAGQGWWMRAPIARFLLSFLTPSRAWQEGLDDCVAEDYEFARGKAKGGSIVCRSPPHVVSRLVNNGCLLTRMRRLNNPGGRLNTPHQGSGSRIVQRPEMRARWSLEEGGNEQPARSPGVEEEGRSESPFQGVPHKASAGPTP